MTDFDRREFLKRLLGSLAQASGAVVVATAAAKPSAAAESSTHGVQERADRLAESSLVPDENADSACAFLNGAFRNTPVGRFNNLPLGGFRNTPLGSFHNGPVGGFRNTPLGSFGNGGWPNGGWGGFRNGGWPNFGWRNWW
jgi:hypothetical protein